MSKGVGRGVVPIGRLARFMRGVLWRRSWGTVPGDISDSLSTLHEGVSSAS